MLVESGSSATIADISWVGERGVPRIGPIWVYDSPNQASRPAAVPKLYQNPM